MAWINRATHATLITSISKCCNFLFMYSPPDSIGEDIMFLSCPVRPSVQISLPLYLMHEQLEQF